MTWDDVIAKLDARRCVNGDGEVYCECAETVVNGLRVPVPPGHNCEYVRLRTALVAEAERRAGELRTDNSRTWMRRFVSAMEELSKPLLNGQVKTEKSVDVSR
jgi:hypothetical protein